MADFGNRLKRLRIQSKLTQKQLAEKIGVTTSVISYYELQERSPSPEALIKLANSFHVTTDYLLGIEKTTNKTLDISDLDSEEIELLQHTITVLRNKKRNRN